MHLAIDRRYALYSIYSVLVTVQTIQYNVSLGIEMLGVKWQMDDTRLIDTRLELRFHMCTRHVKRSCNKKRASVCLRNTC